MRFQNGFIQKNEGSVILFYLELEQSQRLRIEINKIIKKEKTKK
jgi:hypothetical protein